MIEVEGKIVSEELLTEHFACDLSHCLGECCVQGNAGAPLEADEVDTLEEEYDAYRPYMTAEGIAAIERNGYMTVDEDGDYTTTLVAGGECAYSCRDGSVTYCAIEKAWREGKTLFRKPISCHLYPIRVIRFSDGSLGLNYHRWEVCQGAICRGRKEGIPVYRWLREPIERRFGPDFYQALEAAAGYLANR